LTEKDLKNKKQEDNIINYLFIGVCIIVSLSFIYQILFIPTKINFSRVLVVLILILSAVTIYLVDIKKVTEKSEKKALWKIVIRYMRYIGIIVGIIVLATIILEFILR
jgi:membrane protease YdiL (CAAX protease family)